jgi:hypothetical protein
VSTRHCAHSWPIVPAPGDCEEGEVDGMNSFGRGNRNTRKKPAPTPICPYKSHLPDPGANPGRRGGKPATNHFSYCAALDTQLLHIAYTLEQHMLLVLPFNFINVGFLTF